jgi:hypothetical protein
MSQEMPEHPRRRLVLIGLLSWLSMLAVDFFLHGGLLAKLYVRPSPYAKCGVSPGRVAGNTILSCTPG